MVQHTDSKTIANESAVKLLDECKSTAKRQLSTETSSNSDAATAMLDELVVCVQNGITKEIERANEEVDFQTGIRLNMADSWENYTCADKRGVNATKPKKTSLWKGKKEDVLLDRPSSKVRTVQNFLNWDECRAVERASEGRWVGSEDGLSMTQEAMIKVDLGENRGDLITQLTRRVYDYIQHILPTLDIHEGGQEELRYTHYSGGTGKEEKAPVRSLAHCGENCAGLEHKSGNLIATMIMHCEVPKAGGEANFRNAGVHIKPKQYSATFFSYINPVTMKMDNGFTEHSICPVLEGKMKLVTQKVRLGVNNIEGVP